VHHSSTTSDLIKIIIIVIFLNCRILLQCWGDRQIVEILFCLGFILHALNRICIEQKLFYIQNNSKTNMKLFTLILYTISCFISVLYFILTVCPPGRFKWTSHGCQEKCQHCIDINCFVTTGDCLSGKCEDGWNGTRCDQGGKILRNSKILNNIEI